MNLSPMSFDPNLSGSIERINAVGISGNDDFSVGTTL
jgi:hypothetical protein